MRVYLAVAAIIVFSSAALASSYDASKAQFIGCYAELATTPKLIGSEWEYIVDFYTNGNGSQDYALWGFDNAQISNKWNGHIRQFWNGMDGFIDGADNDAPSVGGLDARFGRVENDWIVTGSDTWSPTATPFSIINEWHAPSDYAFPPRAVVQGSDPDYWDPSWIFCEDQELQGHVNTGETYGGYYGPQAVASQDMIHIGNDNAMFGHGEGLLWTLRVVSSERLLQGDLTWSMPSYGDGHETGGIYEVLGVEIPEPATMSLLGLGAIALLRRRR
jgi:hypothetical protein